MTADQELARLSQTIYLAAEEAVARDIAAIIQRARAAIADVRRELDEEKEAGRAMMETIMRWEGTGCGGDCLASPCTHCDGTGYVEGKGKRLERELAEAKHSLSDRRWIPVTERMPEPQHEVIVWCGGADCAGLAWRHGTEARWCLPEPQALGFQSITHWMPLPEGPK